MSRKHVFQCLAGLILLTTSSNTLGSEFKILAWNVESDGADPAVIADQLKQLGRYHVYALSEVNKNDFNTYLQALGNPFKSINGTHKEHDHLQLLYDSDRLELLRWAEIEEHAGIQFNRNDRALRCPLLARFRDKKTGEEFQIVSNHLARGSASFRKQQAIGLREWARLQPSRPLV